jgi:hypothetical protein
MKKYNLLFALGLTASAGFAQTSYQDAGRDLRPSDPIQVCEGCDTKAAPSVNVLYYVIGNKHNYAVSGCVPGSGVELYSNLSGGVRVANQAADDNGAVTFAFNSKPKVAFAVNYNSDNARAIAGNKQVKTVSAAELTVKDVKVSAPTTDVRISWNAAVTNNDWTFVVQRSVDNRQFEDVATVEPATGVARSYSVADKAPSDAPSVYYRVEARHKSGFEVVAGEEVAKFGPKAFFMAVPTVFENSVQLVMDADKLPAVYTVTDMAGRVKYASGTVSSAKQSVSLSLQPGSYVISVTDKKGKSSSQILIRK